MFKGSRIRETVYKPATLRNTTPVEEGKIGIGFNLKSGEVARFKISIDDIATLYRLAFSHSEGSSGSPSTDVSSSSPVE
ncbi:MAG TPA: hypothetical protein QF423_07660 [Candidatus Scalindua sp.]|jgi:hypothetical protein|nr:hypothetical protein [Candidatus Scalindua sp.]|tara:strand:- start:316 stop:552 length:237 start_codon:yes stop_codon:yes gene_type:complete